jgi:hypothetical protein
MGNLKKKRILFKRAISLLIVCTLYVTGCVVAPFSDIQSAKLVGPGNVEATPHYSSIYSSYEGDSEQVQDNFGMQLGLGITSFMDVRARYELIHVDEDYNVNVFGFGPKFSLIKDYVAFYTPVGFAFGEDIETSETWQVHPTLLFTLPVNRYFEINPSAKLLIPFQEDSDTLVAFNLGAGISSDLEKWAIRPEIGFLFNPGEEGYYFHLSLGFSLNTKTFKR